LHRYQLFLSAALLSCSLASGSLLAAQELPNGESAQATLSPLAGNISPESDAAASPFPSQDATSAATAAPNTDNSVTWKNLPRRVLEDQKEVWLFPMQIARGRHLLPTFAVVGTTGVLMATDPHDMQVFAQTDKFDEFSEVLSGTNTEIATALIPAGFYVVGMLDHDSYAQQTAMLSGEAYLDSAIPEVVLKLASRRYRPLAAPNGNFSDTFFKSHVSVFGKGSSFPSGHAAGAFSIATVFAHRYAKHRWVPWVAYALAGAISFSRVPNLAHFPSDVFVGAVLGYTITRYDVLRGQ